MQQKQGKKDLQIRITLQDDVWRGKNRQTEGMMLFAQYQVKKDLLWSSKNHSKLGESLQWQVRECQYLNKKDKF